MRRIGLLVVMIGMAAGPPAAWLRAQQLTAKPAQPITFSETIAPILYANCVTCHRPGEVAPFALISYEDVVKRGALIAKVTESRYMPPWKATPGHGDFADERQLTDREIAVIGEWVKRGMPRGNLAKMPKLPQFAEGWQLGKPDLILEMPVAYDVPASGPDIYRNFAIPTGLTEDKWVRAVEFRPSTRKVVHHALFQYVRVAPLRILWAPTASPGFEERCPQHLSQDLHQPEIWACGLSARRRAFYRRV